MEAASPIPLPNPNKKPAIIPGIACFLTTFKDISNFVDPSEYALSFKPNGTIFIDSSILLVIIGISNKVNAIIPKIRDPPVIPIAIIMAKQNTPYTIEGTPQRISRHKRIKFEVLGFKKSFCKYNANAMLIRKAKPEAGNANNNDPIMAF